VESQTSRWQLKDGNVWQTSRLPFSPEKTQMDDNSRFFPGNSPLARQSADKTFESIRRDAVTALSGVLAGFWGDIEEQVRLAAIASHENSAIYDDRIAIRLLNQRALELANRYRESLETAFDQWRNPRPRAVMDNKGLSLMSEAQLEVHLSGQQIVELLEHQLMHPLHLMHQRLDSLATALGLPRQAPETNPLRPDVPVTALVKLFNEDDLTPELRRLIFLQLEKRLSKVLDELYTKINTTLEQGFAPRDMPMAQPAAMMPPPSAGWTPDGGLVEGRSSQPGGFQQGSFQQGSFQQGNHPQGGQAGYGHAPNVPWDFGAPAMGGGQPAAGGLLASGGGRPLRYREDVHQQLRAWRQTVLRPGSMSPTAASVAGLRVLAPQELLGIAAMLQGDDPAPYVRALAGDDARPLSAVIRDQIVSGSRQLGYDPTQTRFSELDEDAIDLVGILLQTLSRSHATLQRSRALYGRLVAPYLKLALSDDSLFDQRAHPGRKLLEALSEACDGNTGDSPQDQQTLTHAELAVGRVVEEYRDDKAIFELAASELRDHLDQQKRMREVAEQRAADAVSGRERLQHARRAVDELLGSRLGQRPLTAGIAEFLTGHWRHHLVQTWLREGPSSAQYLSAVAVGESLIQIDADAARAEGARVADKILELQGPLGRCYASCGLDAVAARDSLSKIVTALAFPDQPRSLHQVPVEESAVEVSDAANWGGLRVVGGTDSLDYDLSIAARMRRLRVGQNLRLIEDDGRESAARIAWVSPLTSRFLIVNRRGMRKLVVSPEELAALVGKGRVSLRSSEAPFDEALRDMWQQLSQTRAAVG
jgi:Protein of unknown function (DUF1631)